jgi:hypothetical protein
MVSRCFIYLLFFKGLLGKFREGDGLKFAIVVATWLLLTLIKVGFIDIG